MNKDKLITLGCYPLGFESVELKISIEADGSSWTIDPKDTVAGEIVIALDGGRAPWSRVKEDLIHEAVEYALSRMGGRFEDSMITAKDTQNFMFVFTHVTFLEAVARATQFIDATEGAIRKVFNKHKTKAKATIKKKGKKK